MGNNCCAELRDKADGSGVKDPTMDDKFIALRKRAKASKNQRAVDVTLRI